MSRVFACLVVLGFQTVALGCLNDNELPSHEREFRSQYLVSVQAPRGAVASTPVPRLWLMTGGGALLLAGSVGIVWAVGRARN